MFEVFIRSEIICLGCFSYAVSYSTCLCPVDCVNDIPVFLSQAEASYGPFCCLSKHSHKQHYPKELLIRMFSWEARQIADSPEKCAHNAFILLRIVLPVPRHYPIEALPLQHQVPPQYRQSSAREAFLLMGWHTIYEWFLHRHAQG